MSEDSASPSDHLGPGAGCGSSTSRRTSPGKEKASSPEQDASSVSKAPAPKDLEFITVADPSQFRERSTMRRVRSRVMTDYVSKNESRRAASTPTRATSAKSGGSKKARTSSGESSSQPRPSVTSAPDYSRISPQSLSLPIQTLQPFFPGPLSPNALIVQSPSSRSTSSNDTEVSLTHKRLVHQHYQRALNLLVSRFSPSGTQMRPELIDWATQYFFDAEQQRPTPLGNFIGAPLDPFRTMPQASSRRVDVSRLKFSCTTTSCPCALAGLRTLLTTA